MSITLARGYKFRGVLPTSPLLVYEVVRPTEPSKALGGKMF
jgi:hypothetical protein